MYQTDSHFTINIPHENLWKRTIYAERFLCVAFVKRKKKYAAVPIWKKIFPGIMQDGTLTKGKKKMRRSLVLKWESTSPLSCRALPRSPVLSKTTEHRQEGASSSHPNINTSAGHQGNISWNRKSPCHGSSVTEKVHFVPNLTAQNEITLWN